MAREASDVASVHALHVVGTPHVECRIEAPRSGGPRLATLTIGAHVPGWVGISVMIDAGHLPIVREAIDRALREVNPRA